MHKSLRTCRQKEMTILPMTGPIYRVGAQFTEQLNYSTPLKRPVETIWYRYERYFIIASDYEVDWTDPPDVPVKEYIFRYGKPSSPGALVPGQYPVYSLIPGSPTISRSPRWSRSTSLGATSPIASDPKQTF